MGNKIELKLDKNLDRFIDSYINGKTTYDVLTTVDVLRSFCDLILKYTVNRGLFEVKYGFCVGLVNKSTELKIYRLDECENLSIHIGTVTYEDCDELNDVDGYEDKVNKLLKLVDNYTTDDIKGILKVNSYGVKSIYKQLERCINFNMGEF